MKNKEKFISILLLIILIFPITVKSMDSSYTLEFMNGIILSTQNILGEQDEILSLTATADTDDHRQFYIVAESKDDLIETIKYAKKQTKDEQINFEENGIEILATPMKRVELTYTFADDGIYAIYAKDSIGNSYTYTVYSYDAYPISVVATPQDGEKTSISITSALSNITQVKVTKLENLEEEILDITPAKELSLIYENEYGEYQLDIYDEIGFHKTSIFVIGNANDIPQIDVEKDENNHRIMAITVQSESNIKTIKYAKKSTKEESIDFSSMGTEIPITSSNIINFNHTFSEDGIYDIYVKNVVGNSKIKTVYAYKDFPISIDVISKEDKTIQFDATGTLSDITEITIGGQAVDIEPARTVPVNYTVQNYGIYNIDVTDELGFTLTVQEAFVRPTKQVSSIEISTLPTKNTYIQNVETLNLSGGKIKVNYADETSEIIEMTESVVTTSGFSNETLGAKTIIVTYEGKSTSFEVSIIKEGTVETYTIDREKKQIRGIKLRTPVNSFLAKMGIERNECDLKNVEGRDIQESEFVGTGAKLRINNDEEFTLIVIGDITGDGQLDIVDLSQLVLHIVEKDMLEGAKMEAADIDENREVDIVDLSQMVLVLLDKISL